MSLDETPSWIEPSLWFWRGPGAHRGPGREDLELQPNKHTGYVSQCDVSSRFSHHHLALSVCVCAPCHRLFFGKHHTVIQSLTRSVRSHGKMYFCGSQTLDSTLLGEICCHGNHSYFARMELHGNKLIKILSRRVKKKSDTVKSIFLGNIDDPYQCYCRQKSACKYGILAKLSILVRQHPFQ